MSPDEVLIMSVLWFALILALVGSSQSEPTPPDPSALQQRAKAEYERHRQAAIRINDLAGNIHSIAEAHALVDAVKDVLASNLPPAWVASSLRNRISRAEFAAISDPSQLIPEDRIAGVWNEYVREIGALDEALLTAAEIHNLRDAAYSSSQWMWARRSQTIWTVPSIYAIGADGRIAQGCRPLEALRVIHDIEGLFDNVRSARDRLQKGIVPSDLLKKHLQNAGGGVEKSVFRAHTQIDTNPVWPAERRYVQEHGTAQLNRLVMRLSAELFPE
jgi:hypothetical protein